MSATIFYGCDELPFEWERYHALCNALEVRNTDKQPTIKTLNRWRVDSPKNFTFVVHAVPDFQTALSTASDMAEPAVTDAMKAAWEATEERARALAARAIIVTTPMDLFPSTGSRGLMEDFAEQLASESKRCVIWEATGAWPTEETRDFAEGLGLTFALDPFLAVQEETPFTHGDGCFRVNERRGARRSFNQYDFERLVEWAKNYDRVFTLLRGQFKVQHAKELKMVLEYDDAF